MTISSLLKPNFTPIIFTLFITLQITACNSEDQASTVAPDIGSSTQTDTQADSVTGGTDSSGVTAADIKLSWVAPAEREDNTALSLSEISAYKIYYGSKQGQYSSNVFINDGSTVNHTFKDFSSGTYYFAITTYDTGGRESTYSQEIQVTI